MRKSTSIFKAVLIALFAVSLGVEMVSICKWIQGCLGIGIVFLRLFYS